MIEPLIADLMLADTDIATYTDSDIYVTAAPVGTEAPYIVIEATDTPGESDVLSLTEIDINLYDYNEDQRPARGVSQQIKNLLNYGVFPVFGGYETIRIYFKSRTTIKEADQKLYRINMSFTGRATETLS